MSQTPSTHDVIVVGARCAGAATALLLAARGYDVVLVDRAALPSDTLSTHGLARGGVVQLSRWGLLDRVLATGAPPIREVGFGVGAELRTRRIKDRAGVDMLLAPRRLLLDEVLADAAQQAGAHLLTGTTVTGLLRAESGRAAGVAVRTADSQVKELRARFVVGADGLRSTVARLTEAPVIRSFETDAAIFYTYVDGVDWRGFEFHVAPCSYAGVFPTHDGQACVWLTRPGHLLADIRSAGSAKGEALLSALDSLAPALAPRLRTGRVVAPVRGAVALPNHVRVPAGPGWALVGDAGYHRDPITGHGITDAFRDAELLSGVLDIALTEPRLEREALADYADTRDAALDETFRLTRALARFPEPIRFVELQVQLSEALDREALMLASLPAPAGLSATPVA